MKQPAAFSNAGIRAERDRLRTELALVTHQVITCGVAADHPDANLTRTGAYIEKWNSQQAEAVRNLRDERDRLRAVNAELLAALQEIAGIQYNPMGYGDMQAAIKSARAAIAKAEGTK